MLVSVAVVYVGVMSEMNGEADKNRMETLLLCLYEYALCNTSS